MSKITVTKEKIDRLLNDYEDGELEDIVYGDIGICGCGDPEGVVCMMADYFQMKQDNTYMDEKECIKFAKKWNSILTLFMMYILDRKGFTEHGTSVCSAWLTKKGEHLLELIKKEEPEEEKKE